ncbi:DapH/DapD/GlmU-related protein [Microbacterium ginsengiterrae]|uniref:DapH/DapD/GlmU-related protein n=1 Tax=Microbacterium ginsengiterrae TaxID=546115 RepID=UPI00161F9EE3|nr:DapH/DapD/GlmU-related protein [Microbacterium ginsengiterrae]
MTSASIICRSKIIIGSRVLLGAGVIISDNPAHPIDAIPRRYLQPPRSSPSDHIVIEDDVFLGARVVVLPGVTIGAGSVIGAGSIVSASIPAGVVAAGVPAKTLRSLRSETEGLS